jgi:energy-coupling factor transporter ATP-binding protein EcfA2
MGISVDLGLTSVPGRDPGPATMDLEELLATRLLVQGNSGSGKSHLLRRLLEQSAPHVQQVIIDPEGDFVSLSAEFGHVVVNTPRTEAELRTIAGRVRRGRVSCVLNMESLDAEDQMKTSAIFLDALFEVEREHWHPALVVVDEAQLFAPAAAGEVSEQARKTSLNAMTNLMCRGRKRGLAGIIATQRLAKLAKNVAAEASNFLMGRTFLDIDMARAGDLLGIDRAGTEMFRELPRGSFMALGPALSRRPLKINVGTVVTRPLGTTPKLTPPPSDQASRAAVLAPVERAPPRPIQLAPEPEPTENLIESIARQEAARTSAESARALQAPKRSVKEIEAEIRAVIDIIADKPETARERPEEILARFKSYCQGRLLDVSKMPTDEFMRRLAVSMIGIEFSFLSDPRWREIVAQARILDPKIQGLYMLYAYAASKGLPCPSDATAMRIARIGSRGRLSAQLNQIRTAEGDEMLVMRLEGTRRVAQLPYLQSETLPGDPNGPDELVPAADAAAPDVEATSAAA